MNVLRSLALAGAILGVWQASSRADDAALPGVTITPDVVHGHKDGLALTYDVFRPHAGGRRRR